jgi:imidazolonepropionase-like amidohydrolase
VLLFTQSEIVRCDGCGGWSANAPIAAHASGAAAVIMAAKADVTTIEHGYELSDEALQAMKDSGVTFVPTLAVLKIFLLMKEILVCTKKTSDFGIKLACGGDTEAFTHSDNAREIELMVAAGVPLMEVLTASTLHGWKACGGDRCGRKFGRFEEGVAADIIALDGDPREDICALRKSSFVMKDARAWKKGGVAVDMV